MTRDEYLREVELGLRDLPWRQRRDLVADLRNHLADLPGTEIEESLGSPSTYAAELRTAAGLHQTRGVIAFIRSFRPLNLVLSAAVLAALGFVIAGVVWVNTYRPLEQGGGSTDPGGKTLGGLDGVQATFRTGRKFALGVTVVNTGRFTVRILGVPWETEGLPWTARLMMSTAQKNTGGMVGPYVRFHPVDLPPGDVIFLFYKGVFACHAPESRRLALTFTDFPVRYSFLWRTDTVEIPLYQPVAIYFPKGCRP